MLDSKHLLRTIQLDLYEPLFEKTVVPPALRLLCINDAHDMETVTMHSTLERLSLSGQIPPTLVVALYPQNRMQEYGTAQQADYANRGTQAGTYMRFVVKELLPYLEMTYHLSDKNAHRAFAGFSLGGLSAFDIVWNSPKVFGVAGVFSGALWWRSQPFDAKQPDADRIVHTMIEQDELQERRHLRFWLQAGTEDEKEDRNNNGIIDAIDDTLDLMKVLRSRGFSEAVMRYVEVEGGVHHPRTWKEVMPDFLKWTFGNEDL